MRSIFNFLRRMLTAFRRPWRPEPYERYCAGVPCAAMRRRLMRQIRTAWRETED